MTVEFVLVPCILKVQCLQRGGTTAPRILKYLPYMGAWDVSAPGPAGGALVAIAPEYMRCSTPDEQPF
eukprot:scaffold87051_cov25-Tisochrysis_lutea.AAC.2